MLTHMKVNHSPTHSSPTHKLQQTFEQKNDCLSLCFTCELMLIYFCSFLIFLLIFSKNRKKHYLCQQNVFTTQCYISARTGCNLTIFLSVLTINFFAIQSKNLVLSYLRYHLAQQECSNCLDNKKRTMFLFLSKSFIIICQTRKNNI